MSVPDTTRTTLKARLWRQADSLDWAMLSPTDKSRYYEAWTKNSDIGGRLTRYMDHGKVRVYIKDTLLKDYMRSRLAGSERPFRVFGIPDSVSIAETYTKPHGRRLADGRVICWGRADDWKTILMALHERAFNNCGTRPYAAVFLFSSGRFHEDHAREPVADAAEKLGVERVVWLD